MVVRAELHLMSHRVVTKPCSRAAAGSAAGLGAAEYVGTSQDISYLPLLERGILANLLAEAKHKVTISWLSTTLRLIPKCFSGTASLNIITITSIPPVTTATCGDQALGRLPREAVKSPSPEIFKNHLDAILCNALWDDRARAGRLDCGPFRLYPLCDPCGSLPTLHIP
ncbi:hypothetical protein BTVI_143530 [Pitangus sulphuratus]|nr:hypothetical protein BTVI_143530 [Pitangus sulphuratus]